MRYCLRGVIVFSSQKISFRNLVSKAHCNHATVSNDNVLATDGIHRECTYQIDQLLNINLLVGVEVESKCYQSALFQTTTATSKHKLV